MKFKKNCKDAFKETRLKEKKKKNKSRKEIRRTIRSLPVLKVLLHVQLYMRLRVDIKH